MKEKELNDFWKTPLWEVKEVPFSSAKLEALKLAVDFEKGGTDTASGVVLTARKFEDYLKEKN